MIYEPQEIADWMKAKRGRRTAAANQCNLDYSQLLHIIQGRNKNPTYKTLKVLTEHIDLVTAVDAERLSKMVKI